MSTSVLIYGANGYSGRLIAREAVARGLTPVLAGRRAAVRRDAEELEVPARVFALDDLAAVEEGIAGCGVVLNCAGPFSQTAIALVDACIRTGTHYLDITGEVGVFEALAARHDEAGAAGIMVLPGVGFDVVPTDCLAVHLHRRLPTADRLTLAIRVEGGVSRGTATSMLENLGRAGLARRGGALVPVVVGRKVQMVDFGSGPVRAYQIAWGDLATAYRSTGIENIEVYSAVSGAWRLGLAAIRRFGAVMDKPLPQRLLRSLISRFPAGPRAAGRTRRHCRAWGRVEDPAGRAAVSRLQGPEGYTLTALTAVAIVQRVLRGDLNAGFQTPALAYGPDLILEIGGVTREDVED